MTPRKIFRCVVDDTILITNISEVKKWVSNGSITLVIPVYTLERLALLKHDASQIGINARQTVEFLDKITEGKDGLVSGSITLQGPSEQYSKWSDLDKYIVVEAREADKETKDAPTLVKKGLVETEEESEKQLADNHEPSPDTSNNLSQMLLNKLNFVKGTDLTPPASPDSSNIASTKASPEINSLQLSKASFAIPNQLKSLVNAVVWQAHNACDISTPKVAPELYFVSNSADAGALMRNFGVKTKNVHQLRMAIGLEDQEAKNQLKYLQKHPSPPGTAVGNKGSEPGATLQYEEDSEEELIFKPRGRGGGTRNTQSASPSPVMHAASPAARPSSSHYSPRVTHGQTPRVPSVKPEIPTEEIDPDSFDRGSFGRAQGQRLALHESGFSNGLRRAPIPRGGFNLQSPRGAYRGSGRGFDRGTTRGRGRLFIP